MSKKDSRKVLKERDYKKKMQRVYTLTPADLRFLLIGAGMDKERIEMAHVIRYEHEWLDVTVDNSNGGWTSVAFETYEEAGAKDETRKKNSAYNFEICVCILHTIMVMIVVIASLIRLLGE